MDSIRGYFRNVRRGFSEIYFETYLPTKRPLLSEAPGQIEQIREKYIAS